MTMASDETWIDVCQISDVDADTPMAAKVGDEEVVVFKVGEEFFVTQNLCTHGPGLLSDGFVENDVIECPFHQGKFNIRSGLPVSPPCTIPLRVWEVSVRDSVVCVRADDKGRE